MLRLWHSPISLIDAAYRPAIALETWVEGVVAAATDVFGRERGAVGYVVAGARNPSSGLASISSIRGVTVRSPLMRDPTAGMRQIELPEAVQDKLWFSDVVVDTLLGASPPGSVPYDQPAWGWAEPVRDVLGIHGQDGSLGSVSLAIPLPAVTTLTQAERRLWTRVATHLGAAYRMRQSTGELLDRADAVLSPSGGILHLRPEVSSKGGLIQEGLRRKRYAQRHSRHLETAFDVWKGLHEGTWSLIDYLDTDGKALVVVVKNLPGVDRREALTPRERAAVALAALGHPNKQIAYALGLSTSAIAMLLTRARRKLGEKSRVDMVRSFRRRVA